MRTIIAGSRSISRIQHIRYAAETCGWDLTVVLSGCASGADRLGEKWAEANGIPVERYPADWLRHKRRAGFIRNQQMADRADALIAIWDTVSNGTRDMVRRAEKRGLRTYVYCPPLHEL